MAVPEFYSGKILYPAIAVLLGLSALFGLAIFPRLPTRAGGMIGKPAPDFALPVAANGDAGSRMSLGEPQGPAGPPRLLGELVRPLRDGGARRRSPLAPLREARPRGDRRQRQPRGHARGHPRLRRPEGPQLPDGRRRQRRGLDDYGVYKLPSLVVIDKQGKVSAFFTGVVDEAILDDALAQVM